MAPPAVQPAPQTARCILDPWEDPTVCGPHLLPAEPALDFPGETFLVLKQKEEKQFGEYRTRCLVLEAWERQGGRMHDFGRDNRA